MNEKAEKRDRARDEMGFREYLNVEARKEG